MSVSPSSFEDVVFDVPGFTDGFVAMPSLATANASLVAYGNIGLNVYSTSGNSVTIRVYNASATSVSPVVRVLCFSNALIANK